MFGNSNIGPTTVDTDGVSRQKGSNTCAGMLVSKKLPEGLEVMVAVVVGLRIRISRSFASTVREFERSPLGPSSIVDDN